MKLHFRKLIGNFAQLFNTDYGACGRCNRHWAFCEYHVTNYTLGNGCFPLCEECWQELTPETRLPYYRELWEYWAQTSPYPPTEEKWEEIKKAVLEEK